METNIIKKIEWYNKVFPEKEFQYCVENKAESIPSLLEILEKVSNKPDKFSEEEDFVGPIYATFLLAQLKEKKAYPLLCSILDF